MAATTKSKEFKEYINLKNRENKREIVVEILDQARLALLRKRFLPGSTDEEIDIAFEFKERQNSWKGACTPIVSKSIERQLNNSVN
ncbi:hypothetical protein QYF36_023456 [Acer negundo]|nr:hypothetical protein QYF36_023456 [Acer negundo]